MCTKATHFTLLQERLLASTSELAIPARLKGFDTWKFLLRLSPELRAMFVLLVSVAACVKSTLDGLAVFLVTYVVLHQIYGP